MAGKLKPYKYPKARATGRRAVRGVQNTIYNRTSTRTRRVNTDATQEARGSTRFGDKGREPAQTLEDVLTRGTPPTRMQQATLTGTAGLAGGLAGGAAVHGQQADRDNQTLARYNRQKVAKARYLITDVGTPYARAAGKRWPHLKPGSMAAGAAVGGATGYSTLKVNRKEARRQLDNEYRKQQRRERVAKARLERYEQPASERRKERAQAGATGAALGGGVYAGYRYANNKLHLKAGRPKPKMNPKVLGLAVGGTGLISATGKRDKYQYRVVKSGTVSAFGVDHGLSA